MYFLTRNPLPEVQSFLLFPKNDDNGSSNDNQNRTTSETCKDTHLL